MWRRAVRQVVVVALVVGQWGCQSVYRFECTSNPTEAGVVVEEQMQGETPCTVEIPKDSDLIHDGKITFTFCLQNGREKTKVVDLHGLKPSNPFAEIVSAPFVLVGFVLAAPFLLTSDEDEEDSYASDDEDDKHSDIEATLLGFGFMGMGAGVYLLCGGHPDAGQARPVHVNFEAPADVNAPVSDCNQPVPVYRGEVSVY
jgi:hypothetical protein